jgi:hypothetical protein
MRASIEKLSAHIQNQPHLDESEKEELLDLLSEVEEEVDEDAPKRDVAALTNTVNLAAEVDLDSFPHQLEENLLKIEVNYPRTAAAIGRIADVLSRMGI